MKNFTKSGFLYYELSQLQGKPAIIIYSDKETESKVFANDMVRKEYMNSLDKSLKEAGVILYQVPYSAVWINTLTLLSVKTVNSKIIVLEFPWGYFKHLKYPNIQLIKEVYDEIIKNLNPSGTIGKYLTKTEADDIYLSIANAEVTYATQANVINDLNKKANKATTLAGYGINDAYTKAEVNAKVSSVYKYKGSVVNYEALPKEDNVIGDVYNIEDTGANYAWTGTAWNKLSETIDLTNYITNEKLTEELNKKADKTAVVDLISNQEIAGNKIFTSDVSINGALNDVSYGKVISTTEGTLSLGDETKNVVLKAKNNAIVQKGADNYVILDSENYGKYIESTSVATIEKAGLVKPDGTTITITADGTITSVGGGSVSGEKYGIRGDYSTRYGIVECPNGLISYTGKNLTFANGIRVELAGKDQKALIGGALHRVESNTDFDLFYIAEGGFSIGGEMKNFLECSDVFYQEAEPENGQVNCAAWWNPAKQIWSFKSNAAGNVWTEAVACRIAHIHANEENITGISYAGNRIIDDEIFVEKKDLSTVAFSGRYVDLEDKPTINNVELTGNKTSSDLNLISNINAVINNSLTLQEDNASLKINFVETPDNKKVSEVQINGADYIDVLAQTHFLVAPTCGEQTSYADDEFMPKKSILSLIHMYLPKVHTNIALTSSVKDDGDATYPYLNTFNVVNAEATDIPTVILSSDQILSGNWSSISEAVAGAVTIRTKEEIAAGTTIPQIILQKSIN